MSSKQKLIAGTLALVTASGGFFGLTATPALAASSAARSGAELLSKVQSAVASEGGFQYSYKGIEAGTTEYATTDVGKGSGSQSVTVVQSAGKGSLSAIVVGTTAYFEANTRGLDILGFGPSAARAEAGKWISVPKAADPSVYQSIAAGLTSSSVAMALGMSGSVTELRSRVLGQNVIELKGTAAQTVAVQTGTADTLYLRTSGTSLPVELIQDNPASGATYIYSHWGQVPHINAPHGAVAYQASWA